MDTDNLVSVFLSASIPLPDRNPVFYRNADVIAIRDSVKALATVVLPRAHLVWGGHPSITPLVRYVADVLKIDLRRHMTLYQSKYFEGSYPADNSVIEERVYTEKMKDRESSLAVLRSRMMDDNKFSVGVFIGGMEGVIEEYNCFCEKHPSALVLPIATTGAAACIIYNERAERHDKRLSNDYAYMSLFHDLLDEYLKG